MTTKKAKRSYTYDALQYSQRHELKGSPTFVLFHAPAGEIAEWADVDRLSDANRTGAQRQLRPMKVSKVRKFLAASSANTIPTSVIVALDTSEVTIKSAQKSARGPASRLTIRNMPDRRPGLIIDGQHRVFGVAAHDPKIQLNVIGILGGDDAERAFQFIVINNTPTRVSKDHIKALNLNYDSDRLNDRLVKSAGLTLGMRDELYDGLQVLDRSSPFKGLLAMPTNPDGFIPPRAVEGAFAELKQRRSLLGIEEYEIDVFREIWTTIKSLYTEAWNSDSRLLNKVSIYALTVFIAEGLKGLLKTSDNLDLLDEVQLRRAVRDVLRHIPQGFWVMEWEGKELDTSLGRRIVVEALDFIDANGRRKRPWYQDVGIIDPSKAVQGDTKIRSRSPGARKKSTIGKAKGRMR